MDPSIEMELIQRLTRVETKLDLQLNAKDLAIEALSLAKENRVRVEKIEDGIKWVWRTLAVVALGILAKWVYQ